MSRKDVVMESDAYGECEMCGKHANLIRTYFIHDMPSYYWYADLECIKHCRECVPSQPAYTMVDGISHTGVQQTRIRYYGTINDR